MRDEIIMSDDKKLTSSEAVYGFAGWLTCRDKEVTMSARHDAAVVAKLVNQFCKENELEDPREEWATRLIHPQEKVAVASVSE